MGKKLCQKRSCQRRVDVDIPSFNADADSIAHIPGDEVGPEKVVRGAAELIKAALLFREMELVAECVAPHHCQKARRISLLDVMQQYLAGEAEVSTLAHMVEMLIFRP